MALSLIGTNCSPLDSSPTDIGSTIAGRTFRTFHRISTDITAIKLVYSNMTGSTTGGDGPVANPFSLKCSVERVPYANRANINAVNGTLVPVQFAGVATGNMTTALALLESDLTPFTAAAGDFVMVRTYAAPTGGTILPGGGPMQGGTSGLGLDLGEGYADTDTSYAGTIIIADTIAPVRPIAILGQATDGNTHPSVAIVGDSIGGGTGDTGFFAHFGNSGFLARACWQQDTLQVDPFSATVPIGYVQTSRGGEQIHQWVTFATNTIKPLASLYATDVWSFLWGNDLSSGAASIKTDLVTLANWYTSRGKTFRTSTMKPGSTSTDGWKTVVNQTPDASIMPAVDAVDAYLRDTTATGFFQSCATPAKVFVSDLTSLVSVDSAGNPSTKSNYWPPASGTIVLSGTATAATTGYLKDTSKTLVRQAWRGYTLFWTSSTGVISVQGVSWNDVNNLVAPNINPAVGDAYELRTSATVDGGHPATFSHQRMATVFTPAMLTQPASSSGVDPYKSDYTNAAFVEVNFKPNPPGSFTATGLGTALRPEGDLVYTVPANMQGGRIVFERRLHFSSDPWVAIGKVDGPDANTAPPAIFQDLTVTNGVTYEWRAYALPKGDFNPAVFP